MKQQIQNAKNEIAQKRHDLAVKLKLAEDIPDGTTEYEARAIRKKIKGRVTFVVGLLFIVAYFAVGFILPHMFEGTWFARFASEHMLGFASIDDFLRENVNTIMNVVSIIFVWYVVVLAMLMSVKLFTYKSKNKRYTTVMKLLASFIKYIGAIVLVMLLLGACGVDTGLLMAGAGVIGIVIGLGAQHLIADILAGVFIVFENNIQVDDIVILDRDNFRGVVHEIGIRTTKVKNTTNGDIKIINNSELRSFINQSQHSSIINLDLAITHDESLERVERVLKENFAKIEKKLPAIIERMSYNGVTELGKDAVLLRVVARCDEENKFQLTRDLNREFKLLFDANKIARPFQNVVVRDKK